MIDPDNAWLWIEDDGTINFLTEEEFHQRVKEKEKILDDYYKSPRN